MNNTDLPKPAWIPSTETIENSNIFALIKELKLKEYSELHAWSVKHRSEFWELMIQRLGIRFRKKYEQILNLERGVELPRWLVGASLNITESCFQAPTDSPAIVFQPEGGAIATLSYGELQRLTNRVSNGLVAAGFQVGDAIAIDMPMTAESVAIYLGIIQAGCVVVSIADSFAPEEIATRLRISQAKGIFTQDLILRQGKQLPLYSKVIEANAPTAIVIPTISESLKLRSQDLIWHDFLSKNEQFEAIASDPEAHTNILFSSGTTGEPKAIPWNQTTPIKCASDGHLHHDIHSGEVVAWPTNLGWMMGPWLIYASLINQATIGLYYGAPTTREFGQFVQDAGVNMLGVVPSLVKVWRTSGCMEGLDWHKIKLFSSTGECSHPQDMLYLMALANYKPIVEYCGGTEIGGGYLTGTLVQTAIPATFTTPALGIDCVILDENNHPANQGELWLIPPSIGLSTELLNKDHHQVYFADAPSIAGTILRRHGDRMEKLANGYYRAHGRVDDTMNLGGIKVSAAEIEQVLNNEPEVYETAAIAISSPEGGPNRLIIYLVSSANFQDESSNLQVSLQNRLCQHLNPLFKIYALKIVEKLPRTASNKIMHRVLRKLYLSNE